MRRGRGAAAAVLAASVVAVGAPGSAGAESLLPGGRLCFEAVGDPGSVAVVNLTPVRGTGTGFGLLTSSDATDVPVAANVNYTAGSIDPNVAVAPIGVDGEVCFSNSDATGVHLVADQLGTLDADVFTPPSDSGAPARRADTRDAGGDRVLAGERRCFEVSGAPGDAAIVNLTPVRASGVGYGQLVPSDVTDVPVASAVNVRVGSIDPNVAVAEIGPDGSVCYANGPTAEVDVVADQLGSIDAAAYRPASPSGAPVRLVDTRVDPSARRSPGAVACFVVAGDPGDAAIVNLTTVRADGTGFGQLTSSDAGGPALASNVNHTVGSIDPNVAIAEIGADGRVCYRNGPTAGVDLVADHVGTIDGAAYQAAPTPVRLVDTRTTPAPRDLVLAARSVGDARFGGLDDAVIAYVSIALGAPTDDEITEYPVFDEETGRWEQPTLEAFAHPFARRTCWSRAVCATFGGATPDDLVFVGWRHRDTDDRTVALATADGIRLGSRWSDHLGEMDVPPGGCYALGSGTTAGVHLDLRSNGAPFLTRDQRPQLPDPSDVVVIGLESGEQIVSLEGDC